MTTKMKNSGDEEKNQIRTEWLFVQTASSAELVPQAKQDAYTLILRGVEWTILFSDRPMRKSGHESNEQFVKSWTIGENSFASNPPNAELVIFNLGKDPSAVTLELTDPQWNTERPNRLSYTATIVGEGAIPIVADGTAAALFIDTGSEIPVRVKKRIKLLYDNEHKSAGEIATMLHLDVDTVEKVIHG
jgi:hypothetical protein